MMARYKRRRQNRFPKWFRTLVSLAIIVELALLAIIFITSF